MELTDEMQTRAKALSDPSRFRLFRHIWESPTSVGVAELTELLGFNHNAIRQHLAILTSAGLVAETTEVRSSRGRPRKLYSPRLDALDAFDGGGNAYTRLASMLLELHASDLDPHAVGFTEGEHAAAGPDDDGVEGAIGGLLRQLAIDGFEPGPVRDGATVLENCPFADVAEKDPAVICEMHRGLIDGYLAARGGRVRGELLPRPPREAGCGVRLVDKAAASTAR